MRNFRSHLLSRSGKCEVKTKDLWAWDPRHVSETAVILVVSSVGVDFKSVAKTRLWSESRTNLMSAWRR